MRQRTVGIIGGMGPEATVDLMQRVIQATPAQDDQDHLRMLVDNNPKVPSRIKALLEGSGEDPAPVLVRMARDLERWGADFLAMPCNTAHHFHPAIQAAVGIPVLNMIELTAERVRIDAPDIRKLGVLASTAVIRTGLYRECLAKYDVAVLYPRDPSQDKVLSAIRAIKAGNFTDESRDQLQRVSDELVTRGAEVILIACTELSVVAKKLQLPVVTYDSAQVLAEAIVAEAMSAQLNCCERFCAKGVDVINRQEPLPDQWEDATMSTYLKKATKTPETDERETQEIVERILKDVKENGEKAYLRHYGSKFKNWDQKIILSKEEIAERGAVIPEWAKDDLKFAYDQVYGFALRQKESIREFETELYPGVTLGQRLIPCNCAGCYIPGGLFAHAASAIMSIATAKAAGVPFVVAASPSHDGKTINPAILYAVSICNPDVFLMMGGTHAIAAMAYGHFTGKPADVIVGPGNRFVAEAKRILYGQIGIDVFAGPTESLIIADKTADPYIVAIDLMSQAEHGYDSPVWLVTDSKALGEKVLSLMPKVIADLPDPKVAQASWRDYGEVVLCADREEMAKVGDDYAAEHVQVMAEDLDWWLKRLSNYGSLFLGEGCTVPYGDKTTGTNHILPTKKAGRYSGGLSVGKFIKTVTYQKLTKEANRKIGAVASRISRLEGMEGHARAADVRLRKYFPGQKFDFEVYQPKQQ